MKGRSPTTYDDIKKWQYVERWNWIWGILNWFFWGHYKFVGTVKWTTKMFPIGNVRALGGHIVSGVLVYFAISATNDSGVSDENLPEIFSISSAAVGTILCALTFLQIGMKGSERAQLGPAPPMREPPGGEVAAL